MKKLDDPCRIIWTRCEVCDKLLNPVDTQPQGAHRVANTIANRRKYGSFIINHPLNIAMTCSLRCNSAVNIGNNPGKVIKLLHKIIIAERKKYTAKREEL